MGFRDNIRSRLEDAARFNSDRERRQHNERNSRHGAMGGTNSFYGEKGDGPGSYVKTGYRYATTRSPGGRGSDRKEIGVYTWMPDAPEQQAPSPAPPQVSEPEPEPEPYKPSEPSQALRDARSNYDQYKDRFNDTSAKLDTALGGIASAAAYGNAASDDYQRRFLPSLKAQANLEAHETGKSGRDAIARYQGAPPEYDDPKELFNYYSNKVNSAIS